MSMKANTLRMIEKKDRAGSSMALLSRCIRPGLDYVCTSDLHLDYVYERQKPWLPASSHHISAPGRKEGPGGRRRLCWLAAQHGAEPDGGSGRCASLAAAALARVRAGSWAETGRSPRRTDFLPGVSPRLVPRGSGAASAVDLAVGCGRRGAGGSSSAGKDVTLSERQCQVQVKKKRRGVRRSGVRKPDFLFTEPPPIAPEFNPEGASRHRPHRKSLGLAPRRPASRAASQTGTPRLALARLSLRARLRFPAEPDLGRSSGCAQERPGGLGPAPLRAAGLRVGRGRSPGASARTEPRHSRRRAQVEVFCGPLTPGPKAGRAPGYPGKVYFRASLPRPACALPSSPRVQFVFFVFFPRRFSVPPSLCGTRPPPTPRANWRALCACPGGVAAGPGAVSPTGRGPRGGPPCRQEQRGREMRGTSRTGRGPRQRPGPASLPICRTKAAEAAELRWRPSTGCKQNQTKRGERKSEMALLKMEPRPLGRLSFLCLLLRLLRVSSPSTPLSSALLPVISTPSPLCFSD
uniref:Translation initiation factor IF-2-like n=1 Tax=Tursiops truncatus TaxID=9739 RepID=A0A2U4B670_TURTR|nr:translation initiation factor IF-2-like [Tursiops truncatus]